MNNTIHSQSASRMDSAIEALVQLESGELTEQQALAVNPWSRSDEQYRHEFLSAAHLLSDIDSLGRDQLFTQALKRANQQPVRVPFFERVDSVRRMTVWGAVACLLVFIGLVVTWQLNPAGQVADASERYLTRIGEQKSITLADGSRLVLNTGSELIVRFDQMERAVQLLRGEAYFAVQADPTRPFRVSAGGQSITVLGTEFNVRKRSDGLNIGVVEGLIAVRPEGEMSRAQIRLSKGQWAKYRTGQQLITGSYTGDAAGHYLWRKGVLEFNGDTVMSVVQELNRYSAKKILIEDKAVLDLTVTAVVSVKDIALALEGLESTLPIKVRHEFDRIVLVGEAFSD